MGGKDFDNRIVDCCIQDIKRKKRGKDLAGKDRALQCLRTQCERANRTFPPFAQVTIEIGSLFDGIDFPCFLTRVRPKK